MKKFCLLTLSLLIIGIILFSSCSEQDPAGRFDRPFFLYYPMILVHSPFLPTPDLEEWNDNELRQRPDDREQAELGTALPHHFKQVDEYEN